MKDYLKRLERSHHSWFLIGILFLFFLLRLPSLFEPYWYGDEGIYETIGLALSKGRILYTQIWDNKPPLLYVTYAIVHGNQFAIRLLSLLAGAGVVVLFYLLSQKLFRRHQPAIAATVLFTFLFGLPLFEGNIANAENFMLIFILAAGLLIFSIDHHKLNPRSLLLAGILLGIAFLYKIVGIFDFAAFLLFLTLSQLPERISRSTLITYLGRFKKSFVFYLVGFLIPLLISCIYFLIVGALPAFIHAAFLSTVGYVGYNNTFIIPQGLLLSKLFLLVSFILILYFLRNKVSKSVLFIGLWTAFSLFNSFFSQRPYTHYVLVLVPSFSLLAASIIEVPRKYRYLLGVVTLGISLLILQYFNHWSLSKSVRYYTNYVSFLLGNKSLKEYEAFFDRRASRDTELANYINQHQSGERSLYVWGNSAQLYYLTQTLPPGRFTVAYHVQGNKAYIKETTAAVQKAQPQSIIVMHDSQPIIFPLYNYKQVLTINGADIYERID